MMAGLPIAAFARRWVLALGLVWVLPSTVLADDAHRVAVRDAIRAELSDRAPTIRTTAGTGLVPVLVRREHGSGRRASRTGRRRAAGSGPSRRHAARARTQPLGARI